MRRVGAPTGLSSYEICDYEFATETQRDEFRAWCEEQMHAHGYGHTSAIIYYDALNGGPAPRPPQRAANPWVHFPWQPRTDRPDPVPCRLFVHQPGSA